MNTTDDGGPAFPEPGLSGLPNGEFLYGRSGMSLRDHFAGLAMQAALTGMLADGSEIRKDTESALCECAYRYADKMLKARANQSTN